MPGIFARGWKVGRMSRLKRSRFPEFKRDADGKPLCRGCGGPVKKPRLTWCSDDCVNKYHPAMVISAVEKRDKGVCQLCGANCDRGEKEWLEKKPQWDDYPADPNLKWPEQGQERYRRYDLACNEWRKLKPRAEYDHIIPFSEGGPTTLENMRTLCRPCHVKVTTEWRKNRKKK